MDISTWVLIMGAIFGTGGVSSAVVAWRKMNATHKKLHADIQILTAKTESDLQQVKEQSFRELIKELTLQRQNEQKEHNDCEAEKDALRDKYDSRIENLKTAHDLQVENLKNEIDLRGTRILALKTIIVDNHIRIPDGL